MAAMTLTGVLRAAYNAVPWWPWLRVRILWLLVARNRDMEGELVCDTCGWRLRAPVPELIWAIVKHHGEVHATK